MSEQHKNNQGWERSAQYVLKALEALGETMSEVSTKLNQVVVDLAVMEQHYQSSLSTAKLLEARVKRMEARQDAVRLQLAKWLGGGAMVMLAVSAVVIPLIRRWLGL